MSASFGPREAELTVRVHALGVGLFGARAVKDTYGWMDEHGRLCIAWLMEPMAMARSLGVGQVEPVVRGGLVDTLFKSAFPGATYSDFAHSRGEAMYPQDLFERLANTVSATDQAAAAGLEESPFITAIPVPGWPWPTAGDVFYSVKRKKLMPASKPEWLIRVPGDSNTARAETWGIDFCRLLGDRPFDGLVDGLGDAIVARFPGEDVIVTHAMGGALSKSEALGPAAAGWDGGKWRENGKSVRRCGGMLFPSLAVGPVPATNFGPCILVARVGLALGGIKPFRPRGPVKTWIFDTDAWTGRLGDFVSGWAISAFEQMHGHSDYLYNIDNHVWPLGAPASPMALGGPGDPSSIDTARKLSTELKRRFRVWKRDLTPEQVLKVQEKVALTNARYAYLEAKSNGVVPMSAFPVAVCPASYERPFRAFLDASGWDGELLALDVPEEILLTMTDDDWFDRQTKGKSWDERNAIQTWAALQYGWHVADVLRKRGEIVEIAP